LVFLLVLDLYIILKLIINFRNRNHIPYKHIIIDLQVIIMILIRLNFII